MNLSKVERIAKAVALCVIAVSLLTLAVVAVSYRLKKTTKQYQVQGDGSNNSPFRLFDPQTGDLYHTSGRIYSSNEWKVMRSIPPKTDESQKD